MADYIAAFRASASDILQHGIKGMRWGVRRPRSQLRAAAKARPSAPAKKESTNEKAPASSGGSGARRPESNIQDHVESSADRYNRLASQARNGRASDMTEQDLKFFNARTEALAKINKMNEQQPSWLKETTTKVVQQAAQRQMQGIADSIADKYIGDPIKNALKGAAVEATKAKAAEPIASKVADAAKALPKSEGKTPTADVKAAATKVVETVAKTSAPEPSKMRFADALQFYKDNPSETPVVPEGYSGNAAKIFLDEVAKLRKK